MKNTHFCKVLSFCFLLALMSSCSIFGGGKKSENGEDKQKKPKPLKCRYEACHVRMNHYHEGQEYKGKRKWFLRPFFFFNKNPKIGEGRKEDRRDSHYKKNKK